MHHNFITGLENVIDNFRLETKGETSEFRDEEAKQTAGYLVLDFLLEQLENS